MVAEGETEIFPWQMTVSPMVSKQNFPRKNQNFQSKSTKITFLITQINNFPPNLNSTSALFEQELSNKNILPQSSYIGLWRWLRSNAEGLKNKNFPCQGVVRTISNYILSMVILTRIRSNSLANWTDCPRIIKNLSSFVENHPLDSALGTRTNQLSTKDHYQHLHGSCKQQHGIPRPPYGAWQGWEAANGLDPKAIHCRHSSV